MLPQIGLVEFLLVRPFSSFDQCATGLNTIQHDIINNDIYNNTFKTWPSSSRSQNVIPVTGWTSGT